MKLKLKDRRGNNPNPELTKVEFSATEKIWVSDYWDGAINGMLEYQNELYWFEMTQENEEWKEGQWYRRFTILRLSKEQLEKELEVHEDFQRYVGTYYDCKQLKIPPKFEEGKMNELFDKHSAYCKSRPFEDNEAIGWMEN